jgi:hypothetical protein
MNESSWLKIEGNPVVGLQSSLEDIVKNKVLAGKYAERDIKYIASLSRPVLNEKLAVTAERLEKLRAMCQSWDVDFRPVQIASHRRFVGRFIVAAKRAVQPIIKAILKDTIAQQRNFNAAVISAVTDLSNEVEKLKASLKSE